MDQSAIDSLFGGAQSRSIFAGRILEGEKVETIDTFEEKKKQIKEAKEAAIRTPEQEEEQTQRTLFIGNLPGKIRKEEVKKLCKDFGTVETIRIRGLAFNDNIKVSKKIAAIRKEYDESQGVSAYVVFENVEQRDKAVEGLKGKVVSGFTLRTDAASPKNGKHKISAEVENRTVFVGSLKANVTEDQIRNIFANAGTIDYVHIPRDKETGHSRNIAYVTYTDERDVEHALQFNEALIDGRAIKVTRSATKQARKEKAKRLQEQDKKKGKGKEQKGDKQKKDGGKPKKEGEEEKRPSQKGKLPFQGAMAKPERNKNIFVKKYLKLKKSFHRN